MSRNWDESPESDTDKKFHDLRESGWKGPIDQDGNKVENLEKWIEDRTKR